MTLGFYFIGDGLSASISLVVSIITFLTGRLSKPSFLPVYGLFGVLTVSECLPEMIHFILENSRLLKTLLPLWVSVLITLYLTDRWWWLPHCRYWSMLVGFLYTVMDSLPLASGLTVVSKKGIAPSSLLSSTVNLWPVQHC